MKKITVSDKLDNKYTLEFTRATVMQVEKDFDITKVEEKPMTSVVKLFHGAFLANHKNVKYETIEEIFNGLGNKTELLAALVELYTEPLMTLTDDSGNAEWKANW